MLLSIKRSELPISARTARQLGPLEDYESGFVLGSYGKSSRRVRADVDAYSREGVWGICLKTRMCGTISVLSSWKVGKSLPTLSCF